MSHNRAKRKSPPTDVDSSGSEFIPEPEELSEPEIVNGESFHRRRHRAESSLEKPHPQHSRHQEVCWRKNYQLLVEFKNNNGHCRVKQANSGLGKWVRLQRKNCKKGVLREGRKKKLNAIGFEWDPHGSDWKDNFQLLAEFQNNNGNFLVKHKTSLGMWVSRQRANYKKGILTKDRQKALNDIGFEWQPYRRAVFPGTREASDHGSQRSDDVTPSPHGHHTENGENLDPNILSNMNGSDVGDNNSAALIWKLNGDEEEHSGAGKNIDELDTADKKKRKRSSASAKKKLEYKMAPPTPTSGKRKKTDEDAVVNNVKAKRGKKLTKEEKQAAMERAREWGAKQKRAVAAVPATSSSSNNVVPTAATATTTSSTKKMTKKETLQQARVRTEQWAAEQQQRTTTKTSTTTMEDAPPPPSPDATTSRCCPCRIECRFSI